MCFTLKCLYLTFNFLLNLILSSTLLKTQLENTSISLRGNIEERKLGDHDPGTLLASSVRVTSNTVVDGRCSEKMRFEADNQL